MGFRAGDNDEPISLEDATRLMQLGYGKDLYYQDAVAPAMPAVPEGKLRLVIVANVQGPGLTSSASLLITRAGAQRELAGPDMSDVAGAQYTSSARLEKFCLFPGDILEAADLQTGGSVVLTVLYTDIRPKEV